MKRFDKSKKRRRGQGMTEYIIIVAVIAMVCLGVAIRFGGEIRGMFSSAADDLSGAQQAADDAQSSDGYSGGGGGSALP